MSARSCLVLVLIAFACLAVVTEGRLLDPTTTASKSNSNSNSNDVDVDVDASDDESASVSTPVSIDAASSKIASFVESSKLANMTSVVGDSMCAHIHPEELPEECSCSEPGPYSLVIECLKTFNSTYFNDTIGMKIDLDPCNEEGAKLSFDVTEKTHGIDYPVAGIRAGESKNIPIPGLAMIIPGVGNVGVDVAVLIAGNPDVLRLKVGLNACAQTSTDHQVCASAIPGISSILPWYILKGTYSFGGVCSGNRKNVDASDIISSNDTDELQTTILAE